MTEPGVPNGDSTTPPPTAEVAAPVAIPVSAAEAVPAEAPAAIVPPTPELASAANGERAEGETTPSPSLAEDNPPVASVPQLTENPADAGEAVRTTRARSASRPRRAVTLIAPLASLVPEEAPEVPVAAGTPAPPLAAVAANGPGESLDERLRRLETVLVKLADGGPAKTQITAGAPMAVTPVAVVAPTAAEPSSKPSRNFLQRLIFGSGEARVAALVAPTVTPASSRSPWLLTDMLSDLRSIRYMYGDPRFQVSLSGWLIPPIMLVLIFTSSFWTSWIPFAGSMVDKALGLCLSFVLFKVIFREARRYRETIPLYPPGNYS